MCGDSTNPDDVAKLMQEDHAKILFTSPPYSDMRDYKGADISIEHLAKFIPVAKDYVDVMCVNLGIKRKDFEVIPYWDKYIEEAKSCGLKLLSWNVWDKTFPGSIYQQQAMFRIQAKSYNPETHCSQYTHYINEKNVERRFQEDIGQS